MSYPIQLLWGSQPFSKIIYASFWKADMPIKLAQNAVFFYTVYQISKSNVQIFNRVILDWTILPILRSWYVVNGSLCIFKFLSTSSHFIPTHSKIIPVDKSVCTHVLNHYYVFLLAVNYWITEIITRWSHLSLLIYFYCTFWMSYVVSCFHCGSESTLMKQEKSWPLITGPNSIMVELTRGIL